MRHVALSLALLGLLGLGCTQEQALQIELRAPRDADGGIALPPELAQIEVRLERMDVGVCPRADDAARAVERGRLAHVQSFPVAEGMGRVIGETPPGRWALSAIGRDASCGLVLYGCTIARFEEVDGAVVVELEPVTSAETCGCRECDGAGACAPEATICE